MALTHNPSIVRDGLACYIDVNNKRCYDRTSTFSNNLVNNLESLTAAFISNYDSDGIKTTLKNSPAERWAINFDKVKTCQDFTIQFWANFKNTSNNLQNLLIFTQTDSLFTAEEIQYEGQLIEFNGEPLTFRVLSDITYSPQGGNIDYFNGLLRYTNQTFSPKIYTSTINFSGDAWVFVTITKKLSSIKIYKNNLFDEIVSPSLATRTATFSGIVGNNTNFNSNHIMLYDRALEHTEVIQNYNAFKNRYMSEPYVDADALYYLNRANITNLSVRNKIYNFILELKKYNLWNSLVAGWLLSKDYNLGSGLSAISLKDGNDAIMLPGFGNTLPSWENNGIRFYEDGSSSVEGSRMIVPEWNNPNLKAPLTMAVVFSPFSNKTIGPWGSCIFGKTSWGWGSELNHFGFNFDNSNMATYWSYSPTLTLSTFGSQKPIGINYNNSFYMGAMSTDSKSVSTFLNNYIYTLSDYILNRNPWDNRISIDKIGFSMSYSGLIPKVEFNGLISSAFIFNKEIDYKDFYRIYSISFTEFNLPVFA